MYLPIRIGCRSDMNWHPAKLMMRRRAKRYWITCNQANMCSRTKHMTQIGSEIWSGNRALSTWSLPRPTAICPPNLMLKSTGNATKSSVSLADWKPHSAVSQPDTRRRHAISCRWSNWHRSDCGSSFMSRLPRFRSGAAFYGADLMARSVSELILIFFL
jgi:hypothetical protein